MRRRLNKTQRNYIIAGLCMILVIMGVGYAAFSNQLKISGTSNITSNWSVKITNIESEVVSGAPTDAQSPSYTDTTATFKTRLTSPGDTMQYDVTVSNEGDIDAKLDKINVPESNNPAIGFEVSGIEEGSLLEAKQTAILTVTVKYNNVTEQPEDLTADLKVTLDYSQAPEGYVPPVPSATIGGQKVELVESGDGLYEDEYESGRYIYRGSNPDNYIEFNGEIWRIISKETDGTYKIIRNESIGTRAFDETGDENGSSEWGRPADLNVYLNNEYLNSIHQSNFSSYTKIVSHIWNVGETNIDNNDMAAQINEEKEVTWNGKMGLISASDYLRANSNFQKCNTFYNTSENNNICILTNWIANLKITNDHLLTLSPTGESIIGFSSSGWTAYYPNGSYGSPFQLYWSLGDVFPSTYINSNIALKGSGKLDDPYVITN